MAFSAVNPVTVGAATKKDHYDRAFDNTLALQAGSVALTKVTLDGAASDPSVSGSGEAVLAFNTASNEVRVSKDGGPFSSIGGLFGDPLLHLRSSFVTIGEG